MSDATAAVAATVEAVDASDEVDAGLEVGGKRLGAQATQDERESKRTRRGSVASASSERRAKLEDYKRRKSLAGSKNRFGFKGRGALNDISNGAKSGSAPRRSSRQATKKNNKVAAEAVVTEAPAPKQAKATAKVSTQEGAVGEEVASADLANPQAAGDVDAMLDAVYDEELLERCAEALKARPTASKYDYKNKIPQMIAIIKNLKRCVADMRETRGLVRVAAVGMMSGLEERLTFASEKLAEAEETGAGLEEAIADLKAELSSLTSAKEERDAEYEALVADKDSLVATRNELSGDILIKEARIAELEAVASEAETTLATQAALVDGLRAEVASKTEDIIRLGTAHAAEVAGKQAEFDETKSSLEAELASATERFTAAEALVVTLTAAKEAAEAEAAQLKADLAEQVSSLTGRLTHADSMNTRYLEEIETLKGQLRDKASELSKALDSFARSQEFNEARTATLSDEKAALQQQNAELTVARGTLEAEARTLAAEITAKNAEIAEAHASIAEFGSKEKTWEAERNEMTTAAALATVTHEKAVQEAEAAMAELQGKVTGLEATVERLEADLAAKIEALETLEARHEAVEAELGVSAEGLAAAQADLAAKTAEADKLTTELTAFKKHCGVSNEKQLENLCALSIEAEQLRLDLANKAHVEAQLARERERVAALEAAVFESEARRRAIHNTLQDLRGSIRVVARVRPILPSDDDGAVESIAFAKDGMSLMLRGGAENKKFTFDRVFAPSAGQADIFDEVSQLVQSALDGYDVCLFAYGQTGSGKTHTMQGATRGENRGVIPRSIELVVEQAGLLRSQGWDYRMEVSYAEVYNEAIRDLLVAPGNNQAKAGAKGLPVKKGADGRTYVAGLTREAVDDASSIVDIIERADVNRSVAATNMNARSSRSHSIFTLNLVGVNASQNATLRGSLNLCDLAGSERLARSGATGDRLKETQAINKSLSALADVFFNLASKSRHIPFRNSKLTHMLQDCFSGEGKTLMFVNLSPTDNSYDESLCSLRFSAKVHSVDLGKAKKNVSSMGGPSNSGDGDGNDNDDNDSRPSTSDRRKSRAAAGAGGPRKRRADSSNRSAKRAKK